MPPDENTTPTSVDPVSSPKPVIEPALTESVSAPENIPETRTTEAISPEDAHQGESPAVDINPAENVTEIHTPETVTITEVMKPAEKEVPQGISLAKVPQGDALGKEFLKSLLPKLKEKLAGRTEKRLAKILELAREKGEIQNDDVEKLLRVSDSTAVRLLKKLVGRGILSQTGGIKHAKYIPK